MGSHGDVDVTTPFMEAEAKKQEHSLIAPPSEDDLIEKMENVVVHSDLKQKAVVNGYGHKQNTGPECSESLPLRPYAGDCPHYVRTGTCKFGLSCRYNHPLKRTRQFVKVRDYDTENPGMIECKYSIAGVCRNEKSCRYRHPGEVSEKAFPELNFMGLPMRPGEKECPYYMRKGSCGYGSLCIYHHPDPTSMEGEEFPKSLEEPFFPDNYYSDSQHLTGASQPDQASWSLHQFPNSGGSFSENLHLTGASQPDQASWSLHQFPNSGGSFSENLHLTGASQPDQASWSLHEFPNSGGAFSENLHLTGASQPDQASWSLNKFPNSGGSLPENFSPYEPVHSFSPWMVKQPEWNGYQNSSYFHQSMTSANGSDSKPDITVQVEEFPERPGQPECCYFITTGNCKSKFTCQYHHPKNRMPKPVEYVLNENGLPLRPGKNICRDYERIGLCKFGRACQYDHPASLGLVSHKLVSSGLVSRKLVRRGSGSAANANLPVSSATVVGSGDGGLG